MTAPPLAFLPDVFEHHVDELGFLWRQRRNALEDPERLWRSLCDLDARISAHLDGTLAIGAEMPLRLRPEVDHADAARVFTASLALLHGRDEEGATRVLERLTDAEGETLTALTDPLAMTAPSRLLDRLLPLLKSGSSPLRVALLRVFAMRGAALPDDHRLKALCTDEDAGVRAAAWRLIAHRGTGVGDTLLQHALEDDAPGVRHAAADAAVWLRTPWLLDAARQALRTPAPETLPLLGALALLGTEDDQAYLTHVVADPTLGPARFDLARQVGTPDMVERLIAAMTPDDPEAAAAAGLAFWRITGESVAGPHRVSLAAPDADAFEKAFADEVVLPDPVEARRRWTRIGRHLGPRDRLVHGVSQDAPVDAVTLGRFDMIARRELYQRARWSGTWNGGSLSLESFPQR